MRRGPMGVSQPACMAQASKVKPEQVEPVGTKTRRTSSASASALRLSGNVEFGSRARPRFGLNRYFDIAAQQDQKAHQSLDREAGQLALLKRGDLRLVDPESRRSPGLGHPSPLDPRDDFRS